MNDAPRFPSSPAVSRRAVVAGAAWAVPAIVAVGASPALAASGGPTMTMSTPNGKAPAAGDVPVTATVKPATASAADVSLVAVSQRYVTFTGPTGVSFSPKEALVSESGVASTTMTTTDTWAMPGSTISITAVSEGVQPASAAITVVGANAYALGNNYGVVSNGTAGVDSQEPVLSRPTQLSLAFSSPIVRLAGGFGYSLALLKDGTIWGIGSNEHRQLGDDDADRTQWTRVSGLADVVDIVTGRGVVLALTRGGRVYQWGRNLDFSNGTAPAVITPTVVPLSTTAAQIALGTDTDHAAAFARCDDGTVHSWGAGNLGDGSTAYRDDPRPVSDVQRAVHIAAANNAAYAVLRDGTIRSWGDDAGGALGNDSPVRHGRYGPQYFYAYTPVTVSDITSARQVFAGEYCAYAILADGSVRAWGYNGSGQLGDGTTMDRSAPVTVQQQSESGPIDLHATQIGTARDSAYAVLEGGAAAAWGSNESYQLGDGSTDGRLVAGPFIPQGRPITSIGTTVVSTVFAVTR